MRQEALKVGITEYASLRKETEDGRIFEVIEMIPLSLPFMRSYTRVRFRKWYSDVPSDSYAYDILAPYVTNVGDAEIEEWVRSGQMKVKMLVDGNDGSKPVKAGEEVDTGADYALRCMRLGHAEPTDEEGFIALNRYCDSYGDSVFAPNTLEKLRAWKAQQSKED
jgi:hypothetical protein